MKGKRVKIGAISAATAFTIITAANLYARRITVSAEELNTPVEIIESQGQESKLSNYYFPSKPGDSSIMKNLALISEKSLQKYADSGLTIGEYAFENNLDIENLRLDLRQDLINYWFNLSQEGKISKEIFQKLVSNYLDKVVEAKLNSSLTDFRVNKKIAIGVAV